MTNNKKVVTLEKKIIPFKQAVLLHQTHNTHLVNIPGAMTRKELEKPEYWSFQNAKFQRFDRVEAQAVDGSQIHYGIVTYASRGDIRVKFLRTDELDPVAFPEVKMDGFTIKYGGFEDNWIIVNDKTGETLASDKATQQEAISYLSDHFKSVG